LDTVKEIFIKNPDPNRPDKYILELLEISLNNNDFYFNEERFLQILGCAMGKRFAPALANLYLLELDFKATNHFPIKPLYFFRYLDDIFFIWPADLQSLKDYEQFLNSLIPNIKLTFEFSQKQIPFLDTLIYVSNNKIQTRTYFKPTDTHQLLHHDSAHPKHTFLGILKSQFIRFKRLSATKLDYESSSKILIKHLSDRGYTNSTMRKLKNEIWFNYVEKDTVPSSPNSVPSNQKSQEILPIIMDFFPIGHKLSSSYKTIINNSNAFNNLRPITAFINSKNLSQILVRSKLEKPSETTTSKLTTGYFICDRSEKKTKCYTCILHASKTNQFYSTHYNSYYDINDTIYCSSKNLVYLITCKKCKLQYVGETSRQLRDRMNDHRSAIKLNKNTPIGLHFNLPEHTPLDLTVTPIELIKEFDPRKSHSLRLKREHYWQQKLGTTYPIGINNSIYKTTRFYN
jgi:hypothetical protein